MLQPRRKTIDDIRKEKSSLYGRQVVFTDFEGVLVTGTLIRVENHSFLGYMVQFTNHSNIDEWTYTNEIRDINTKEVLVIK